MKKAFKSIARLFFSPYFYLYTSWPVWLFVLNHEGRTLYRQNQKRLRGEIEKRLHRELKQNGIAFTHVDELFPRKSLLTVLKNYANTLLSHARTREGKPFLKALWPDDNPLDLSNPFMQLALSDQVLGVVNDYMGMNSKFFYSSLDLTTPVPQGSNPVRSQNWHRDPEDRKMCKVFIYLTDVDESSGPFTYIQSSHLGGRWGHLFPQRPPKGSYPSEEEIKKIIPPDQLKVCTGRAGSIIFADTAGLHRGGYATNNPRLMFTAEYSSRASLRPIRYRYPADFVKWQKELSAYARYATLNNFGWTRYARLPSDLAIRYGLYD